jgi:hypothetical protein
MPVSRYNGCVILDVFSLLLSTLLYVFPYPGKVARRYDSAEVEKWGKAEDEDVF